MAKEPSPTIQALTESALAIDATSAWQFAGASGNHAEDEFDMTVVSRGPIPIVDVADFGDIAENVTVESNPDDPSYRKIHIARYVGGLTGLEMFTRRLTGELDRGAEGDIDAIRDSSGPAHLISWALDQRSG